ncbi:MAG: hypothetical protein ACYTHK_16600 [Planctomycetota bacterium]|jgi:hypothetical protein
MSSMAKIFVVVNLVLVVAVFGSAATMLGAQDDYRKALDEATKKAEEIQSAQVQTIQDKELQVQTQTANAAKHLSAKEDAEQRRQIAEKSLSDATAVNQQLTAANERMTGELSALRKQIEAQQATVAAAQAEAKDANGKFQDAHKSLEDETRNRAALEGRVQELDDSFRTLQAEKEDLAKKLEQASFWIEQAKKQGFVSGAGNQGADGRVLTVENVAGGGIIVILSVGSADKVAVGDEYRLSRGASFVGFAKVTRVYKDKSVAEFDTQNTGSGAPPQANDRAYVR